MVRHQHVLYQKETTFSHRCCYAYIFSCPSSIRFPPPSLTEAIESVCDPALAAELSKNFFDGLQYVVDRSQITDGEIVVGLHQGSPTNVKFHPRYDYPVVSDKRFDGDEARARMRRQFELLDTSADSPELSQFGLFIRELCLPFSRLWKLEYGEIRVTVEQGKVTKVMIGYSFLVSEANMPKMGDAIFLQAAS